MTELAHVGRSADVDVHAIYAAIHRQARLVHARADVRQQAKAALQLRDGAQHRLALRAGQRRGQLHVFHAEGVQRCGDLQLLGQRKVTALELFPLAQGGFDDVKFPESQSLHVVPSLL